MTEQNGFNQEPSNQPPQAQPQASQPLVYASQVPGQSPVQPDQPQKTNTLAIVSLIAAFFVSILGIILGHIALSQIKKTGEGGRGLAIAGTIIGYVFTFLGIIALIILLTFGSIFGALVNTSANLNGMSFDSDNGSSQIQEENSYNNDGSSESGSNGAEGNSDEEIVFPDDNANEEDQFGTDDQMQNFELPWLGTDLEDFCNVFIDDDLFASDSTDFLNALAENAPDADSKKFYEDAAKTIAEVEVGTDEASVNQLNEVLVKVQQDAELCYSN